MEVTFKVKTDYVREGTKYGMEENREYEIGKKI